MLWGLARIHDSRGELNVGRELGEQLLDLAQPAQEPALLLEAHHEPWANLSALGELTSAWTHLEQGFAIYDPQKHKHHALLYGGHDPGVCCGYLAAEVLWLLGYPDQALQRSQDSLALARELSHPLPRPTPCPGPPGFISAVVTRQAVQARVEEGMALATEHGFPRWVGHGNCNARMAFGRTGSKGGGHHANARGFGPPSELAATAGRDDTYYAVLLG